MACFDNSSFEEKSPKRRNFTLFQEAILVLSEENHDLFRKKLTFYSKKNKFCPKIKNDMYVPDGRRDRMCERMWPYVWADTSGCLLNDGLFGLIFTFFELFFAIDYRMFLN